MSSLDEPIMDRQRAIARLAGSEQLFAELVSFFLEDSPALEQRIRTGLAQQDAREVSIAAHSLKSLAANFDGLRASRAAAKVEELGEQGDLVGAAAVAELLYCELATLCEAITPYRSRKS